MSDTYNKHKKLARQYKDQFFNASPQWQCASILLAALALIGVFTFDWKPISISIIFITVYIYKDKIDFIEFNSAKLKMKETLNEVQTMAKDIRDISEEMQKYRKRIKGMLTNNVAAVYDKIDPNASFETVLKNHKKTLKAIDALLTEIARDIDDNLFQEIKEQMEKYGADFSKMEEIPEYKLPFMTYRQYFGRGLPHAETHLEALAIQMYILYLESQCLANPDDKQLILKLDKQKIEFQKLLKDHNYMN